MTTSSTKDVFRACIGKKVVGVFFAGDSSHLVFDDGTAFKLHHEHGAYWLLDEDETTRLLRDVRTELAMRTRDLQDIEDLAQVSR